MFENLSQKFSNLFDSLRGRATLSVEQIDLALRDIRRALLEADVALEVVRQFTEAVRTRAVGADIVKSVTPGQMVIKIVHDVLAEILGDSSETEISFQAKPPVGIMMVGLQGAGKTTTSAKLALRLQKQKKSKILMASLDVKRPAAQEQLAVLGQQIHVDTFPILPGLTPTDIAIKAQEMGRRQGYDVVIFDTAGRTHIDQPLMQELEEIYAQVKAHEILLVADSLTGQDAVHLARSFHDHLPLTGIILTRLDGDGRGGAALSMRAVTGKPIKFIGTGEKMEALEEFHPQRIAERILGMGDIVSFVEKAAEAMDMQVMSRLSEKMRKGKFDLEDMAQQLQQIEQMGGLESLAAMLPGLSGSENKKTIQASIENTNIRRQRAIISSMTRAERQNPDILKASRKKRIAQGSATKVEEVNRLLKQHRQMADMFKMMRGNKNLFQLPKNLGRLGALGGNPGQGVFGVGTPDFGSGNLLPPGLAKGGLFSGAGQGQKGALEALALKGNRPKSALPSWEELMVQSKQKPLTGLKSTLKGEKMSAGGEKSRSGLSDLLTNFLAKSEIDASKKKK